MCGKTKVKIGVLPSLEKNSNEYIFKEKFNDRLVARMPHSRKFNKTNNRLHESWLSVTYIIVLYIK